MNDDRVQMSDNPYQSPRDDSLLADEPGGGLRSDRVPFIIAAACGLALAVVCNMTFVDQEVFAICVGVIGAILVFDLQVCVLMIWRWRRDRHGLLEQTDSPGE